MIINVAPANWRRGSTSAPAKETCGFGLRKREITVL